jgi:hypothetical protein
MPDIRGVLREIFNQDFASFEDPEKLRKAFFAKNLTLTDLKKVASVVQDSQVAMGGKTVPAAISIPGNRKQAPFMILAQLHGNEPAGLAGIALAMALSQAGKLERDVVGVIGNPLASLQYFDAWVEAPTARQEIRDPYRCGVDEQGNLLPDMNRIPVDFAKQSASSPHIKRAQELFAIAEKCSGILDIHSARGDLLCITDYKNEKHLKHSPIRSVFINLAEAVGKNASGAAASVRTFKNLTESLPNIECQIGIEAGRHESTGAPQLAASFTLSLLHTLGITKVPPLYDKENGTFERYNVKPRITYADLTREMLAKDDMIYMVMPCKTIEEIPVKSDRVIVKKKDGSFALQTALEHIIKPTGTLCYATHQYNEMEAIKKGQVLAVAVPSGTVFKAPYDFSTLFISKSASLYPKDPAVGPWPVAAGDISKIKFCYPCDVSKWKISF